MNNGWVLRTCFGLEKSIDENGCQVNEHSMISCKEEDDAMKEAERRARKFLTRQKFFLDWPKRRSSCFWIDV